MRIEYTYTMKIDRIVIEIIQYLGNLDSAKRRNRMLRRDTILTDVESIRGVALRGQREAIVVLVRLQMPDTALKSGPHRKALQTGRVSGSADEERLAERNSREQALELRSQNSLVTRVQLQRNMLDWQRNCGCLINA